jgi:hypothetical protein
MRTPVHGPYSAIFAATGKHPVLPIGKQLENQIANKCA